MLHGISSGGALCLVAAASGAPVDAVSVLEPPCRVSPDAPPVPGGHTGTLVELTSTGRRGDAVAYFMTEAVGQPREAAGGRRRGAEDADVARARGDGPHARLRRARHGR